MERPISVILDQITIENKIFRFASELQYTENDERKILLREILRKLQNDNSDKSVKAQTIIDSVREKLNQNELKKKWFRLSKDKKKEQIKLYYESKVEDINERKNLIEKVLLLLENDKLENKNVIYNEKDGKIENIDLNVKNIRSIKSKIK
mgnify:CR=1 FL=1